MLGDPVPENWAGKGRPPHRATEEKARIIMLLAALGRKKSEIASALGVTQPTLNKHYFSNESRFRLKLGEARERVEAKLLASVFAEAEKGNVSAISKLWDRLDKADLKAAAIAAANRGATTKSAPAGKKAAQLEAAQQVGGIFAPPPAPEHLN